jgi:hypothetical protein
MAEDIKDTSTRGALVAIALSVIVIAIVIGIALFRGTGAATAAVDEKRFQAVFTTDNQVYFGKLSGVNGEYATINDAYTIQAAPQATPSPGATAQPNLALVPRSAGVQGPEKELHIASDKIVFFENLKDDSKVVEAIKNKQKEGDK